MSKAVPVVIPDELVLAAIERAERHNGRDTPEVPTWAIYEHLGLPTRSGAARRVYARLSVLREAGWLQPARRGGIPMWVLTSEGRKYLQRAIQAGKVVLPESPQHREWREARAMAGREIERFRRELRECLQQALLLLDADPPVDSDAWFQLGESLRAPCRRLGSAVHCLWEWAEPADAHADIDTESKEGPVYRMGRRKIGQCGTQT
jgi:hypothetical protein